MTNAIEVFKFEGTQVRTVMVDGEPWFVAADVCGILGLSDVTSSLRALDDDEKILRKISGEFSNRGNPNMMTISESGLYALIMRSNKPEARRFRKWVTSEVLPALRKTGAYSVNPDKEKRRGLVEMRLEVQQKNADVEAARTLQRMIENPVYPLTDEEKEALMHQVVVLTTGYDCLEGLTNLNEMYYSAADIADELGISEERVMRTARVHWLIAPRGQRNEYGRWATVNRECQEWFFTEEGRREAIEAVQQTTYFIRECALGYEVADIEA